MVYYVMIDNGNGWVRPFFPKAKESLNELESDAHDLLLLYNRVAIFKNGELVKEIVREG